MPKRNAKFDGSGKKESIQEEDHLIRTASAATESIADEVVESKGTDTISEDSDLKRADPFDASYKK